MPLGRFTILSFGRRSYGSICRAPPPDAFAENIVAIVSGTIDPEVFASLAVGGRS